MHLPHHRLLAAGYRCDCRSTHIEVGNLPQPTQVASSSDDTVATMLEWARAQQRRLNSFVQQVPPPPPPPPPPASCCPDVPLMVHGPQLEAQEKSGASHGAEAMLFSAAERIELEVMLQPSCLILVPLLLTAQGGAGAPLRQQRANALAPRPGPCSADCSPPSAISTRSSQQGSARHGGNKWGSRATAEPKAWPEGVGAHGPPLAGGDSAQAPGRLVRHWRGGLGPTLWGL